MEAPTYRRLIMTTLKDLQTKEIGPIRLYFSEGSQAHFQITTLSNRKQVAPRKIVEEAVRQYFLREVIANEPANK